MHTETQARNCSKLTVFSGLRWPVANTRTRLYGTPFSVYHRWPDLQWRLGAVDGGAWPTSWVPLAKLVVFDSSSRSFGAFSSPQHSGVSRTRRRFGRQLSTIPGVLGLGPNASPALACAALLAARIHSQQQVSLVGN